MSQVRIRSVALPVEHGGWGFLLEPIVLGLLVAPGAGGVAFSIASVAAFLVRHPLRLTLSGRGASSPSPRLRLALALSVVYAAVAAAALVLGVLIEGAVPLVPLVAGSPLALLFVFYDARKKSRELVAEIAGALGLAASAPAIALCDGWPAVDGAFLWGVLAARTVPSIVYVRARLRRQRGQKVRRFAVMAVHVGLAGIGAVLAVRGNIPYLAEAAFLALVLRAAGGLYGPLRQTRATAIGVREIVYGLVFVIVTAAGYRLNV